jgi:hypothetical protein
MPFRQRDGALGNPPKPHNKIASVEGMVLFVVERAHSAYHYPLLRCGRVRVNCSAVYGAGCSHIERTYASPASL